VETEDYVFMFYGVVGYDDVGVEVWTFMVVV